MNNKTITGIIILVVVIIGGWFLMKSPQVQAPADNSSTVPTNDTSTTVDNEATSSIPETKVDQATITYTNSGYSPKTLTVKAGTTVTWVNNSSSNMWTASGMHPTHIVYSGTSLSQHCPDTTNTTFDECKAVPPGGSWSFTFNKVGSWGYHNHVKAGDWGTVVVE